MNFKYKFFMIELIMSHLADRGAIFLDDYVESLADFFNFIVRGGLDDVIAFEDYYNRSKINNGNDPIRIFDPANENNNIAGMYKQEDKNLLVTECGKAADAIDAAIYAPTKGKAQEYWRKVFNSAF